MEKLQKIIIDRGASVNKALRQMDEAAEKILFVVDGKKHLLGTVTDGDIRRWILRKGKLSSNISKVMNRYFSYIEEGTSPETIKNLMVIKKIESLPVLNKRREVVSLINWRDLFQTKFKKHKDMDIPVVIMSGGEGSRLSPFTKVLPKPLLPIGDQPIIGMIIDKFTDFGCKKFYLSLNYKADIIKAYFESFSQKKDIEYIKEDSPLGTAGSLYLLRKKLKSTFFVSNCDIFIEADYTDILKFHLDNKNKISLVVSMKHYVIPYGICEIAKNGYLKTIKEKPEYDFLVNTGLYILEPDVLASIPKDKHYHITELISTCIKKKEKIGVYPISEKSWIDIGQWEELQRVVMKFGKT